MGRNTGMAGMERDESPSSRCLVSRSEASDPIAVWRALRSGDGTGLECVKDTAWPFTLDLAKAFSNLFPGKSRSLKDEYEASWLTWEPESSRPSGDGISVCRSVWEEAELTPVQSKVRPGSCKTSPLRSGPLGKLWHF